MMVSQIMDLSAIRARQVQWFTKTRSRIDDVINPDGSPKIPQFDPPHREAIWILPALYTGGQEFIDLANRIVARYADTSKANLKSDREQTGMDFGIFQSNSLAHCLHRFRELLSPAAEKVMIHHAGQVFKLYKGSAQPDYKFHGANDNMPAMATMGLILAGEAMNNAEAIRQGVWNLNQFRRLLSRSAWASEFNSSTYSAVTLASIAKIATFSHDKEVRDLALDIEARLWAEILLHYHPGTFMQAGAQSRAYSPDIAGHTHSLQLMLWLAYGEEATGRDPIQSYFHPDGVELIHLLGWFPQRVTEFTEQADTDLHVPTELTHLISERKYPAILRGRAEAMIQYADRAGAYHTELYMEENFSLGTVNSPMCGGEQTSSLHITYRRTPKPKTFRDAATVFCKYLTSAVKFGEKEASASEGFGGETFVSNQGWFYAFQKHNVGMVLSTPHLKNTDLETDILKLCVVFPAHYGPIERSIVGASQTRSGAVGEDPEVVPVSVEAGQVYIHIQPLIPTSLPRNSAVRFVRQNRYEVLELINYQGPQRAFSRAQCSAILNGAVITVDNKAGYASLEAFHARQSTGKVQDYFTGNHRFVIFRRDDVELEVTLSVDPVGVQTCSVDGRHIARPVFESNQVNVSSLPFMTGPVGPNEMFFPWPTLEIAWYPANPWMIGSRGLPDEPDYFRRLQMLKGLE